MLKALDSDGCYVFAEDATRFGEYYCPVCGELLIYKSGPVVVPHFAHFPNSSCAVARGESLRHEEMKIQIADKLKVFGVPDFEVSVESGNRADVIIKRQKKPFAIECQVSPLSPEEWRQRTIGLNRSGYPCLWVWDLRRVLGESWPFGDKTEVRIPNEIRLCHKESYGRVYALTVGGDVWAIHFKPVYHDSGDRIYYAKTIKEPVIRSLYHPQPTPMLSSNSRSFLIELGDGVWWKGE